MSMSVYSIHQHDQQGQLHPLLGLMLAVFILSFVAVAYFQKRDLQSARPNQVSFTLPQSNTSLTNEHERIHLEVDFDETISWNGRQLSQNELRQRLERVARYSPNAVVSLKANQRTSFGVFFKTVKNIQSTGIRVLEIVQLTTNSASTNPQVLPS
ncbi:biopolymer transporter ExbD [Undibacterium cyanobacteriorum]|uniref:Biopolymer transporter ExbD n=1 Tax=Undibacterium cyanobacteriorum TaxID=3073561 RepID=A0ABY9RG72_9BURK|nr:biopolymer transporter ExbD [Undibacterium sp. 20NA77.5]WMW79659.1 biopolymer transporter ExbD [Undibacterium sp. 20NA77.5]